jgi:hypothetical protein
MHARAVDEGAATLRALRHEEWQDLGLGALAIALAVAATQVWPQLAVPLFVGGVAVGARGVRAAWRRWDLVDRFADDVDAYVIPEVQAYASRHASMERRHTFASLLRSRLPKPGLATDARVVAVARDLEALATELEDDSLALDPVAAVACMRLLSDTEGPLLDRAAPAEELRSRVRQIRSGFRPRPVPADSVVSLSAARPLARRVDRRQRPVG